MMSQEELLLRPQPQPQPSSQELLFPNRLMPFPQEDKRMISHNKPQLLLELVIVPPPQELLELHPQFAADKSLIEICLQMFFMVYHMCVRMSLFPDFENSFLGSEKELF